MNKNKWRAHCQLFCFNKLVSEFLGTSIRLIHGCMSFWYLHLSDSWFFCTCLCIFYFHAFHSIFLIELNWNNILVLHPISNERSSINICTQVFYNYYFKVSCNFYQCIELLHSAVSGAKTIPHKSTPCQTGGQIYICAYRKFSVHGEFLWIMSLNEKLKGMIFIRLAIFHQIFSSVFHLNS